MNNRRIFSGAWRIAMMSLLAFVFALPARQTSAQSDQRCFAETGYCVSGRLLQYWNQNGGLATFGLPLSAQMDESGLQVQYFERQRFELHPENARPYDVLLGRLGAQLFGSVSAPPGSGPASGCIWFPETQHNVCNQQVSLGFASYWQSNGLEFDGGASKIYQESLALFGYPITEAIQYTTPEGTQVQAQWFERARFEWHPNNPDQFKVLLGRLGADVRPWTQGPWRPTPPAETTQDVTIFLISQGGGSVGCGDQVVPVVRRIASTDGVLVAALNELFNLKSQTIGESGLYNALYQSDVRVDRAAVVNGQAQISLSGTVRTNGVCDKPRIIAQIEQTVRQFSSVTSTAITLNNQSLADAIQ